MFYLIFKPYYIIINIISESCCENDVIFRVHQALVGCKYLIKYDC